MVGTPPVVINKVINGSAQSAENGVNACGNRKFRRAVWVLTPGETMLRSATAGTKRPECSGLTGRCQPKRLEGRNVGPVYLSQHLM